MLRTVTAIQYVTPLREGGSVPAVCGADDDGLYVVKFRGSAQGPRVLIAELLGGEIARALDLPVPEIVFVEVDPVLARSEPDPEIQVQIRASGGINLGLDFLPGALGFDPLLFRAPPELASAIVWLDAYLTNVDRTARNPNMLIWHKRLWLMDHGAALYFHHSWADYRGRARSPFPQIRDHVLLPRAGALAALDDALAARLTPALIEGLVAQIPDAWLTPVPGLPDPAAQRAAYATYLLDRLRPPRAFVEEAIRVRTA